MRSLKAAFVGGLLAFAAFAYFTKPTHRVVVEVARPVRVFGQDQLYTAMIVLLWAVVLGAVLAAVGFGLWAFFVGVNRGRYIYPDASGVLPVVRRNTAHWLDRLRGVSNETFVPVGNLAAPATVAVYSDVTEVRGLPGNWTADKAAAALAGQQRIQLMAAATGGGGGNGIRYAAHAKLLAGAYDRPQRETGAQQAHSTQLAPVEPVEPEYNLRMAVENSRPDYWIVGQQPGSGKLATLELPVSVHAGIVGATGTGKSSSLAATVMAEALRAGYHPIILDPKGGEDWSPWARHCEYHETDAGTFPDQVRTLESAHEARMKQDSGQRGPTLVLVEEVGDLMRQIAIRSKRNHTLVNDMLDRLMRLSRASRIHMLFVDQYPEHWTNQMRANTKWMAAFKVGPGQGNMVGDWHAERLPPRGMFRLDRAEYVPWHVTPLLRQLLAEVPASRHAPLLLPGPVATPATVNGRAYEVIQPDTVAPWEKRSSRTEAANERRLPEVDTPYPAPTNVTNAANTAAKWYDFVLSYMARPENAGLWSTPAQGVRDLARAMSVQDTGDMTQFDRYLSVASETCKRIRSEARLPGGERLGHDITAGYTTEES